MFAAQLCVLCAIYFGELDVVVGFELGGCFLVVRCKAVIGRKQSVGARMDALKRVMLARLTSCSDHTTMAEDTKPKKGSTSSVCHFQFQKVGFAR
jgi:hypothetical protein